MHSLPTIIALNNRRTKLNDDEREAREALVRAGFKTITEWSAPHEVPDGEFLFHTTSPEGKQIGPMNDREVFWMLEGYKAGKDTK